MPPHDQHSAPQGVVGPITVLSYLSADTLQVLTAGPPGITIYYYGVAKNLQVLAAVPVVWRPALLQQPVP
jgi:hypothetical protein